MSEQRAGIVVRSQSEKERSPWHKFTLPGHLSFSAWQKQDSLAELCSLKVVLIGDASATLQKKYLLFMASVYC